MHGTITPNNRVLNDIIGATTVSLYAWFDYRWAGMGSGSDLRQCQDPVPALQLLSLPALLARRL
jgi:hypothetical protein